MRKRLGMLLLCLSLMLFFAACVWRPASIEQQQEKEEHLQTPPAEDEWSKLESEVESTPAERFIFTNENYPAMGGSLAALPLGEAITAAALGITRQEAAERLVFTGSTTDNYHALVNGIFDILLAYEPSAEAKQYAEDMDFTWEMTPIGRDALVFITNAENPVMSLTPEEIRAIYSGELTNWAELGGMDAKIIPYQRNRDSGSQTLFDLFFPLGDELMTPPADYLIDSMLGLLEVIADYDDSTNALGYTVYYYLTNMETDKLSRSKILAINGIEANNETIASNEYPYCNDFYVVIDASLPADDPARILYNWICSEQVRELGERENYVMLQ